MTSPLLALPREIRDTIYTRLNRDIAVKDEYGLSHNHIFVRIKGAPLPQLLLVNWQLHNEYKKAINCSAHIAIDTLEPFRFHHLDARLQHILAKQVRSITLMIDWCVRSAEQEKRLSGNTNLFWRMFQELAHEIVHPRMTTLKIAYLDSMGGGISFEMLDVIERIILGMRQEQGGRFFTSSPRKIEGLRLVQSIEAYQLVASNECAVAADNNSFEPVRIGFWAYSAMGCKLDERSFWTVDDQGKIAPPATEDLGRWRDGKYQAGVQVGQDMRGMLERKRVDAILNATNYAFVCKASDCHKCLAADEGDVEPTSTGSCATGTCNMVRGYFRGKNVSEAKHTRPSTRHVDSFRPRLFDAPRDMEPGWR